MATTTANSADTTIPVSGLTCASCESQIQDVLEEQPGVTSANVNLIAREARVAFDPQATTVATLVEAIRSRGYGAENPAPRANLAEEQAAQEEAQAEEYGDLKRKAIASGVLGAAAMVLSMPLMSAGAHSGSHDSADPLSAGS